MYCPKCKQQVAGDICPNCGYKSAFRKMDDLGGTVPKSLEIEKKLPVVSAPSTSHKDKPAVGGFKPMDSLGGETKQPEVTVKKDVPASSGFKPMNVLPGAETGKTTDMPLANTGDKPATGGLKRMDPVGGAKGCVPGTTKVTVTNDGTKENKPAKLTKLFNWKRWLPVAAVAAVVILVVIFVLPGSNGSVYEEALAKKIDSECIAGEDLALSYQYTNAILGSIDYRILKEDKSKDCAEVKFTYVDVLELAEMYSMDVSADIFYQHCIDCITAGNAPTLERTIVVSFAELTQKGKTELKVIDSFELADVMTGGVATEYYKMIGGHN